MSACDCYHKITDSVREKTEDPDAEIDYAIIGMFSASGMSTLPRIGYTYRKKKKSGEFMGKKFQGTIIPTFCPFCGVKLGGST